MKMENFLSIYICTGWWFFVNTANSTKCESITSNDCLILGGFGT